MTANGLAAVTALVLASGCAMHDVQAGDVVSYQRLAADVAGELQAYCSSTLMMSSAPDCTAALQRYLDRLRLDMAGMGPLAGRIGDQMLSMGVMHAGDMRCGMDLMSDELDRHADAACTSPDLEANRAEAMRHCTSMQEYVDHMRMRGAEAAGKMGPGMMGAGMMDPGPGTMDPDHQMPGCPAEGG